ncbi:hypothetical protein PR202_gb01860 [Eleusine coracana subsp. coracana]|uniref:CULT domain-containing protein n=1 Tax=Eleusine coracana subsp. coracana TaxID=191504 RepID=A0AAV5DWZ5_ELECO|nr:hypothetical protein PR202_gb01860 [Eleusine coracana subsp. coracana]
MGVRTDDFLPSEVLGRDRAWTTAAVGRRRRPPQATATAVWTRSTAQETKMGRVRGLHAVKKPPSSFRKPEVSLEEWAETGPNRMVKRLTEESSASIACAVLLFASCTGVSIPGTGGVMADWDGIPERERRQMEEILQLDLEELHVEVVDDDDDDDEEEHDDTVDAFLRPVRYCLPVFRAYSTIRQLGRLEDGALNVVARGQQRFRLKRHWHDADRVVWGEVQIIEEDAPLRTPRDAFAQLAACNSFRLHCSSPDLSLDTPPVKQSHVDSELECDSPSPCSNTSNHSSKSTRLYNLGPLLSDLVQSSDKDKMRLNDVYLTSPESSSTARDTKRRRQYHAASYSKQAFQTPLSFWPRWVYEMYDSYTLARTAADLWRQIIANPSMEDHVRKPDILSFHIGSKLPISEYQRQKLLELDGTSYRLQKEIQILQAFNLIKCRDCQSLIAKRSDMVVMSTDGPLGAYVNPHGCVHETITVSNATGLALSGSPSTVHSWFPG